MKITLPLAALAAGLFTHPASAQILVSAGTYAQTFNSLASSGTANTWTDNTTLAGWYASKSVAPNAVTAYRASIGSENNGALYSYGAAASTERALGSAASGTPGTFAYGVRFINDLADTVTNITVSYTGEQWRNGGNATAQTLAFSYLVSDTAITSSDAPSANIWTPFNALDFNSPTVGTTISALDGNAAANQQVFAAIPLTGVTVLPGQEIFLRWVDLNDTGNDHGLAIDDLTVTFNSSVVVTNPPTIATSGQPLSRTNNAGTAAAFTVTADGSPTLYYQWRKGGTDLSDTGNLSGSTLPTLTLTNLLAADAGDYDVVVTNSVGAVTSVVATLTVIDPVIYRQPANRSALVGQTATFSLGAAGTPPLACQWLFEGSPIADATDTSLSLTNVQTTNQGGYACVFTGYLGVLTSAVATLTVTVPPGATLAQWDFNETNAPLASPPPAVGTGTAALLNNVTATWANGASADPGGTNRGWNTASYPTQGTANKLSGVQFSVSTAGYKDLLITCQERHSNTASKYQRFQYSTNGTDFVDKDVITYSPTDNSWVLFSVDLSAVAGAANNPNFAFRVVAEWESTAIGGANNNYVGTTSYGPGPSGGTIRYDLVTVYGTPTSAGPTPIPLHIKPVGSSVNLTWSDPAFTLQSAPAATGIYTNVPGAASGYTLPAVGVQQFFRLISP